MTMNCTDAVTLAAVLAVLALAIPCTGATHYISPDGDDEAEGSRAAPWQSLEKASEAAGAGDIVVLLPGSYPGRLRPIAGGSPEAPLTFRAEPRMGATLTGLSGETAIALENLECVRLEGLHVDPTRGGGWLTLSGCSNVVIEDCRMENSTLGLAARIDACQDIQVRNSVFHKQTGGINMFQVSNSLRLLFEGNAISRAAHSPFQFYPDGSNHYVVIRGNVFHAAWGRNFEHFGTQHCLFEHNIITHALDSGWSGSATAKFATTWGIFRFNRIFNNPHGPIHLYPFRDTWLDAIRVYNNVFDENGRNGIAISSGADQTQNLKLANNIFSRNDRHGLHRQIALTGGSPEQVRLTSNVFTAMGLGTAIVTDYGSDLSVGALEEAALRADHGARYEGNIDVDPGYVDADRYNHALREDSALRDRGSFLTTARGAGEGTRLPVEDAAWFYSGYGIDGEQGDLIAIGTDGRRARVIETDHRANTLLLDREVRWQDGDPVSLPWSGSAPDIGVYEHGEEGRAAVQVDVEPFRVRPGDEVIIRAIVHGEAEPTAIRWWLGDGNIAEGAEVTHRYADEYDYPIFAQVVAADGRTYRGAGYVWVAEPVDPSLPLIHSTWGPEDDTAWWRWKSYGYPGPAGYRDVVEGGVRHGPNSRNIPAGYVPPGSGTNYRHVRAPEDRGGIPTRIHPVGWDIDRYPEVFVRYRLGQGTPLMVTLKVFAGPQLLVAINPATSSSLAAIGDHLLHDDGEWHELLFDVRAVRDRYPELQVLEGLYFVRSSQAAVREGHWYDLDEVIIRPATTE